MVCQKVTFWVVSITWMCLVSVAPMCKACFQLAASELDYSLEQVFEAQTVKPFR